MITQILIDTEEPYQFRTVPYETLKWPLESAEHLKGQAVLIAAHSPELLVSCTESLLKSPAGPSILCFALPDMPVSPIGLYEILPSESELLHQISRFKEMFEIINSDRTITDPEERLLQWLYLHENAEVQPAADHTCLTHYRYPAAELMGADTKSSFYFLESLVRRSILSEKTLINRIRLCPSCDSGMLNIVDHCPSCRSLDIYETSFIHCFTCGHVAPESEFIHGGILRCDNCSTILRHIGSDYDRAMAQFRCRSCGSVFDEPAVAASCFTCGAEHLPADLNVRNICSFTLTTEGRLSIRTGKSGDLYSFLEDSRFVAPSYLYSVLSWYLMLSRRHRGITAHLVVISIVNMAELIENSGRFSIVRTVEEFVRRIREKMRTTDLAARIDDHSIALFLPLMDPEFIDLIGKRVEELKSLIANEVRESLAVRWNYQTIPCEDSEQVSVQDMIIHLKNNLFR